MASSKKNHKEKSIRRKVEEKVEEPALPKYRDRAKERREDQNPDYEPTADLGSFAPPGSVEKISCITFLFVTILNFTVPKQGPETFHKINKILTRKKTEKGEVNDDGGHYDDDSQPGKKLRI